VRQRNYPWCKFPTRATEYFGFSWHMFLTCASLLRNSSTSWKHVPQKARTLSGTCFQLALQKMLLLRWIIPSRVPRVAAADPPGSFRTTDHWTVLLHGKNEVFAASRLEAAHRWQRGSDELLISADAENHHSADCEYWSSPNPVKMIHRFPPSGTCVASPACLLEFDLFPLLNFLAA
jgi:hypothetical protein